MGWWSRLWAAEELSEALADTPRPEGVHKPIGIWQCLTQEAGVIAATSQIFQAYSAGNGL
jgi:hypothetical protein